MRAPRCPPAQLCAHPQPPQPQAEAAPPAADHLQPRSAQDGQ